MVDIGADLGLLGLNLLSQKLVNKVWNVEVSKKALEDSKEIYSRRGVANSSEFIYSDGFTGLPKKLSQSFLNSESQLLVIVFAGLGSTKILNILEKFPKEWLKAKNVLLLIVSHTHPLKILDWSSENEWKLRKEEYFTYNDKIYPILLFSKGFSDIDLFPERRKNNYLVDNLYYWKYWDNYYEWQAKYIENKKDKVIQEWMKWYSTIRLKK
ncbi:tRNA (adenine(22)-N(1))-methyltransferase TrmK [Mycoplasma suis]|uniref:tRNA (adenine(22)-N(1))-methyltransferase TrmK n=1 Tax=Mycoplasma suis TaxID=57372 RepID=UPI001E3022E6|nr:tRNA (adenine(22)-N(1))-methyltransferase TrmK [Mycoplasma suis]